MKKQLLLFAMILLPLVASAYDIEVKNADGVTIYYNYINDGLELEVTYGSTGYNHSGGGMFVISKYSGNIVIPDQVTHMNRTRKVTKIGNQAFENSYELISVTIPNSVNSFGNNVFQDCYKLSSVNIPNGISRIEDYMFSDCRSLSTFTIPSNITSIGKYSFYNCSSLSIITIPDNVTSIEEGAFSGCKELTTITFPHGITRIESNMFSGCSSLTSFTISDNITSIGEYAFADCDNLKAINIPNSITSLERSIFEGSGLTSIKIPSSVVNIKACAFLRCENLISVTIPNSVTSIGPWVFERCNNLTTIISQIEEPFGIGDDTFEYEIYMNASLFVPNGTKDKYKQTGGWKKFVFIEEGTGGGDTPTTQKCEKPTISYENGKLTFSSATDGAVCQYSITDTDIKAGSGNEVQLGVTYNISVYATKSGYDNSETATATLCWIDQQPKTEGITNGITNIPAQAVLIQSEGGSIKVQGVDEGTQVNVYSINGTQAGSAISQSGAAIINTNLQPGSIAIVKIGQKSVKVVMK